MNLLNYTTKVSYTNTVAQIQKLLSEFGAKTVAVDYTNNKPTGLRFSLMHESKTVVFFLPTDYKAVHKILQAKGKTKAQQTEEHALRVAWRIRKTWIEAQLSLVQIDMANIIEVFLPYAELATGVTFWHSLEMKGLKQLESPNL
jgi:molybdopterin-guanine dinucleotide biosynthesis protein A